jgi:WD40 repeat protein
MPSHGSSPPTVREALDSPGAPQPAVTAANQAGAESLLPEEVPPPPFPLLTAGRDPSLPAVPGYDVLAVLGRGGMGVVYKARQHAADRVVALKMMRAEEEISAVEHRRFAAEVGAAGQLNHPNIVQVFEVGECAGRPFYSQEYVAGGSLAQRLGGAPVPVREAARLVATLADAVQVAHGCGIVHRDLKPANVLLTEGGAPKVADFGLAKRLDTAAGLTHTGAVLGTPSYMAPEQAAGRVRDVGPAADTYALGAILYELLTGRPPFRGETPLDTLRQVAEDDPVPPGRLNPRLPPDLEIVCLKCLRKDAARRYESAGELGADLRRFLAGEPIRARRARLPERLGRWCKRSPVTATLVGALVVAGALLVVLGIGHQFQLGQALGRAELAERERTLQLLESRVAEARASCFSQRAGQRLQTLAVLQDAARLADNLGVRAQRVNELRDLAISALVLPDLRPTERAVFTSNNWNTFVTYDRHLERLAWVESDTPVVSVFSRQRQAIVARLPAVAPGRPFRSASETYVNGCLSPNGRYCALWDDDETRVWEVAGPEPRLLLTHPGKAAGAAFRPDNRQLVVGLANGCVSVFRLPEGTPVRTWPSLTPIVRPSYRQSGVAFGSERLISLWLDSAVQIRDAETNRVVRELRQPQRVFDVAWHPDGRTVAVSCGTDRSEVRLWDVLTGQPLPQLENLKGRAIYVRFHPTEDVLVSIGAWSGLACLHHPRTGKRLLQASVRGESGFFQPGTADDLAVVGNLWDMPPGAEYRTLVPRQRSGGAPLMLLQPSVSADGRILAVGSTNGVILWDLGTGRELDGFLSGPVVACFEHENALLTLQSAGLSRWPVRTEAGPPGRVLLGPPQTLAVPEQTAHECLAVNGPRGLIAWSAGERGGYLMRQDHPGQPIQMGPRKEVRSVAISPDGRFVATGNWWPEERGNVHVWDAGSGALVTEWKTPSLVRVAFSPDNKYLAAGTVEGTYLWTVGDWTQVGQFDGRIPAFCPAGDLLALATSEGVIRLIDPRDGGEVASLRDPNQDRAQHLLFTPEGTRLIAVSDDDALVHVWDLRRIRSGLANIGLDWNSPAYPVVPAPRSDWIPELQCEVVRARPSRDPRKSHEPELEPSARSR